MLPLTFFPQVPSYQSSHTDDDYKFEERISSISREAAIDLGYILDMDPWDIGRNRLHHVNTDVLVQTSKGDFTETIHTASARSNSYHLPHTIIFERNGYVSTDSIFDRAGREAYRKSKNKESVAYQYDLYMDNPSEKQSLSLVDIYSSNPEFISIDFAHESGRRDLTDMHTFDRFNNCGFSKLEISYCNFPMTSELPGPLRIKPGGRRAYVGTVKLNKEILKSGGNLEHEDELSLGYVHIRAGSVFLTIAIDFTAGNDFEIHREDDNDVEVVDIPGASTPIFDLKSAPTLSNFRSKFLSSEDVLYSCDLTSDSVHTVSSQAEQHNVTDASDRTVVQIPLKGSPIPFIDFGLMTSLGEKISMAVSITNAENFPIRMMHQRVDFAVGSKTGEQHLVSWYDRIFDKNKYRETSRPSIFTRDFNTSVAIQPGETVNDIVKVSMKTEFIMENKEEGRANFDGSVILRFGHADLTFDEWKETVSADPFAAQDLAVELPLAVSMLQGLVTYDANKSFFPAMRNEVDSNVSQECGNSFDRKIRVTNNFSIPLTLRSIGIKRDYKPASDELPASICRDHFDILRMNGHNLKADPGESWIEISLRYKYLGASFESLAAIKETKKCTLVLGTDVAGEFHIPLFIYKGSVVAAPEQSVGPEECQGHTPLFGMDCIEAIKDNSQAGAIIGETMRRHLEKGKKKNGGNSYQEEWVDRIGAYYSSLISGSKANQISLEPVVLSFGIMSAGATKAHSLFIKNDNPISINVTALVASVEGMELRLARTAANVDDYIQRVKRKGNNSMKTYLLDIESPSRDYVQNFSYRDDISLMPSASNTVKRLFHNTATVQMHRVGWNNNEMHASGSPHDHPPVFVHDTFPEDPSDTSPGPLLIDLDHGTIYPLEATKDDDISQSTWTIPPGGVARFEVIIRSPTKRALHNREIAEILTTGLALKTNFGQLLPIIATYKMLSGSLQMSGSSEVPGSNSGKNLLPVPAIFRPMKYETLKTSAEVEINIENTFSSSVVLTNIKSCNKWFEVHIQDSPQSLPKVMGTNDNITASVVTNLSCQSETSGPYPSFYHCALEWLENRRSIEESRCAVYSDDVDTWANHTAARIQAISDMKIAVGFMDEKYGNAETNIEENHAGAVVLNNQNTGLGSFNSASAKTLAHNWKVLSEFGLNTVRGAVRAQFELVEEGDSKRGLLKGSDSERSPTITTTFPSKLLQTDLDVPYLSNQKIEFAPTPIGQVNKIYFPVKNPSGYPVRVKIFGDTNSPFYVRTKRSDDHWWTGGSYFMPDDRGFLARSTHNVTILTPSGSSLSMVSPSLHATSALFHGCSGRRCGLNFPVDNGKSPLLEEQRMMSPIGASSAIGAQLAGHMYNSDGTLVRVAINATANFVDYFALDQESMTEIVVPPYSSAQMGPIYFRPPSRGFYSGTLALENTLTGYETLTIQGMGVMGRLAFFDNKEKENRGSDIELRHGRSTFIFKKIDVDNHGRATKTTLIGNVGDSPIELRNIYLRAPKVSQGYYDPPSNRCRQRGFRMLECHSEKGRIGSEVDSGKGRIVLGKDQSILVHIAYQHDCTFQSMHAELVVEHASVEGDVTSSSTGLLLSYEMDKHDIRTCGSLPFLVGEMSNGKTSKTKTTMILQFWTTFLPVIMFCVLLYDMICSARHRYKSSVIFQNAISVSPKKQSKSKKTGFKNWSSAYRCLSRADPTSTELVQIGREQSRQLLLNTYRKEGMIQPQCVQSNGAFIRERLGPASSGTSRGEPPRRPSNAMSITLNDAIFSKCNLLDTADSPDLLPVIPGGLGWRVISSMRVNQNSEKRAVRILSKTKKTEPRKASQHRSSPQLQNNQNCAEPSFLQNGIESKNGNSKEGKTKSRRSEEEQEQTSAGSGSNASVMVSLPQSLECLKEIPGVTGPQSGQFSKSDVLCTEVDKERANGVHMTTEDSVMKDEPAVCPPVPSKENQMPIEEKISSVPANKRKISGHMKAEKTRAIHKESIETATNRKLPSIDIAKRMCETESRSKVKSEIPSIKPILESSRTHEESKATKEPMTGEDTKQELSRVDDPCLKTSVDRKISCDQEPMPIKSSSTKDQIVSPSPVTKELSQKQNSASKCKDINVPIQKSPARKVKTKVKKNAQVAKKTAKIQSLSEVNVCESNGPNANLSTPITATTTNSDQKSARNNQTDDGNALNNDDTQHSLQSSPLRKTEKSISRKKNRKNRLKDQKKENTTSLDAGSKEGESKVNGILQSESYSTPMTPPRKILENDELRQSTTSPSGSIRTLIFSELQSSSNRTLISTEESEESSLLTISPIPDFGKPQFRPPPGLAPPPGFANEDITNVANVDQGLKDLPTVPSIDAVLAKLLDEKNTLSLQPLEEEIPAENPFIGLGQDMNVMNFLTFLDESMENDNGDDNDDRQVQVEDTNYEALPFYGGLSAGVGSNPWSDSRTPRAFTYGFGVEQGDDGDSNIEGDVVDTALLTPSLILGHNGCPDSDTEQENGGAFDADAFFSDLLE
jgi:hypothetical protein